MFKQEHDKNKRGQRGKAGTTSFMGSILSRAALLWLEIEIRGLNKEFTEKSKL